MPFYDAIYQHEQTEPALALVAGSVDQVLETIGVRDALMFRQLPTVASLDITQ